MKPPQFVKPQQIVYESVDQVVAAAQSLASAQQLVVQMVERYSPEWLIEKLKAWPDMADFDIAPDNAAMVRLGRRDPPGKVVIRRKEPMVAVQ